MRVGSSPLQRSALVAASKGRNLRPSDSAVGGGSSSGGGGIRRSSRSNCCQASVWSVSCPDISLDSDSDSSSSSERLRGQRRRRIALTRDQKVERSYNRMQVAMFTGVFAMVGAKAEVVLGFCGSVR